MWIPEPGADGDAIHDNVAGEIAAITEKVTPASADLLLIEDSAASNAKKKVRVGNLPSGGGGTGALTLIDHQELASAASSISVSSIPGTLKHLLIEASLRTDRTQASDVVHLRVGNGSVDTGSNYRWLRHFAGSASGTDNSNSATSMRIGGCPAGLSDADVFGALTARIPRYADTSIHRVVLSHGYLHGSSTEYLIVDCFGRWANTADEIDTLSLISGTGNDFVAGSSLTLYGMA